MLVIASANGRDGFSAVSTRYSTRPTKPLAFETAETRREGQRDERI